MRKGIWFEILLDRLGLAENVVERLVEEKLFIRTKGRTHKLTSTRIAELSCGTTTTT